MTPPIEVTDPGDGKSPACAVRDPPRDYEHWIESPLAYCTSCSAPLGDCGLYLNHDALPVYGNDRVRSTVAGSSGDFEREIGRYVEAEIDEVGVECSEELGFERACHVRNVTSGVLCSCMRAQRTLSLCGSIRFLPAAEPRVQRTASRTDASWWWAVPRAL